jgi:hypothetical protein
MVTSEYNNIAMSFHGNCYSDREHRKDLGLLPLLLKFTARGKYHFVT